MVCVVVEVRVVVVTVVTVELVVELVVVAVEVVGMHVPQSTGHSSAIAALVTGLTHWPAPLMPHEAGSLTPLHVGTLVCVVVEVVITVVVVVVDDVWSHVSQSTLHWKPMNEVMGLVHMSALYDEQMYGCGTPLQVCGQEPHRTGHPSRRPSASIGSPPVHSSKPKLLQYAGSSRPRQSVGGASVTVVVEAVVVVTVVGLVGPVGRVVVTVVVVVDATHELHVPGHLSCKNGRSQYFRSLYTLLQVGPSQTPLQNIWHGLHDAEVKGNLAPAHSAWQIDLW